MVSPALSYRLKYSSSASVCLEENKFDEATLRALRPSFAGPIDAAGSPFFFAPAV